MSALGSLLVLILGLSCTWCFIVPNEFPTILSLVYSNIPPLKIGQDTRFGIGFRLGPHADFQTLVELGPQTNTRPIAPDDGSPSKRDNPPQVAAAPPVQDNLPIQPTEEEKKKKTPPKKVQPFMDKIVFKRVPGIDDR